MLKFYYAPQSRASGMLWLLEELGEPYDIELVDIRAEGGAPEGYRAIQPNKKVPAIMHDGTVVTERAAMCLYLCERFPAARLAPERLSPERAPFLTWLVYCDAVLDPVLAARALGWKYEGSHVSFGDFDAMVANLERALASRPFIAGENFTAADTQLASGIYWAMDLMKVLPERKLFRDYVNRACARPAFARYMAIEQKYVSAAGA
jgi:glutathione S-transferase